MADPDPIALDVDGWPIPETTGRANHYERAFAGFVHAAGVPCVPIEQARRAVEGPARGVKNPDFLVYPPQSTALVVEVKGKRGKDATGRRRWENWVTAADLDGLVRWRAMYGPGYRPALAFVYAEPSPELAAPGDGGYDWGSHLYRFWAIGLDDYLAHLQSRGPAWKAVAMARREFRRRVRPLEDWLGLPRPPFRPRPRRRRRPILILSSSTTPSESPK